MFSDVLGDTAIIYSQINEKTGEAYYKPKQLQKIADAAAELDKKEGLISFGYKVVDAKSLKAGKIPIVPTNTYWEILSETDAVGRLVIQKVSCLILLMEQLKVLMLREVT